VFQLEICSYLTLKNLALGLSQTCKEFHQLVREVLARRRVTPITHIVEFLPLEQHKMFRRVKLQMQTDRTSFDLTKVAELHVSAALESFAFLPCDLHTLRFKAGITIPSFSDLPSTLHTLILAGHGRMWRQKLCGRKWGASLPRNLVMLDMESIRIIEINMGLRLGPDLPPTLKILVLPTYTPYWEADPVVWSHLPRGLEELILPEVYCHSLATLATSLPCLKKLHFMKGFVGKTVVVFPDSLRELSVNGNLPEKGLHCPPNLRLLRLRFGTPILPEWKAKEIVYFPPPLYSF
jgi:hypothetical protein